MPVNITLVKHLRSYYLYCSIFNLYKICNFGNIDIQSSVLRYIIAFSRSLYFHSSSPGVFHRGGFIMSWIEHQAFILLLGPLQQLERSYKIGSVHPSTDLIVRLFVRLSRRYLAVGLLVFSKFQQCVRKPDEIVCERAGYFGKILFALKIRKKSLVIIFFSISSIMKVTLFTVLLHKSHILGESLVSEIVQGP